MADYDTIVAYAYDACVHCVECTSKKFPDFQGTDYNGNAIVPIFGDFESDYIQYCDDCQDELDMVVLFCYLCEVEVDDGSGMCADHNPDITDPVRTDNIAPGVRFHRG